MSFSPWKPSGKETGAGLKDYLRVQKGQKQPQKHVDYELDRVMRVAEHSMSLQESPVVKNCLLECKLEDWIDNILSSATSLNPGQKQPQRLNRSQARNNPKADLLTDPRPETTPKP